jgi:hypothetical protein
MFTKLIARDPALALLPDQALAVLLADHTTQKWSQHLPTLWCIFKTRLASSRGL